MLTFMSMLQSGRYQVYIPSLPILRLCLMTFRFTNKAVVLPAINSSSKSIYIPANTLFVLHFFLFRDYMYLFIDRNGCSCLYSVLVMHRRTDLWGPDGIMISIFLEYMTD